MQLFVPLLRLIVKINKNKAINRKIVIQLKDINKTYNNGAPLHVLKGINLDIQKGEFVSIMGASGSGKSTLLNILGILDSYDTGEYYLNGTLIKNLSETKAAEYRNRMIYLSVIQSDLFQECGRKCCPPTLLSGSRTPET